MALDEKYALLHRLDEARARLEAFLPQVDPSKEIYPGWTIRRMLAHITGWDDATIASLRAHVAGQPPATPADRGIDEYNSRTVSSRDDLDLDHVLKEFRLTRQVLRTILEDMPDDKFHHELIVPWGGKATVTELIDIFVEHEEEHAGDIGRWLNDPDKPLLKGGN
jgi:hypothetical protein